MNITTSYVETLEECVDQDFKGDWNKFEAFLEAKLSSRPYNPRMHSQVAADLALVRNIMDNYKINVKEISSGQIAAYCDSVQIFEVVSKLPADKVLTHCLDNVRKVRRERHDNDSLLDGHCGWPFGLNIFYTFRKKSKDVYLYAVTNPYCD